MAKKQLVNFRNIKGWIIAAVALTVVFAVVLASAIYIHGKTDMFEPVETTEGMKNYKVVTADDRDLFILGLYDNLVQAYDKENKLVWEVPLSGATKAMVYDGERGLVIVGSQDRNVYTINADDGSVLNKIAVGGKVCDLDYDPNTRSAAVATQSSASKASVVVIDVISGETLHSQTYKQVINTVRFTADYKGLITGNTRANLIVNDLDLNELFTLKLKDEIIELDVARDTGDVAVISKGGYVYCFNPAQDGSLTQAFMVKTIGEGYSVAITDDGKWISAGTREGDIIILDSDGVQNCSNRAGAQITQIYIGEEISYVVTFSNDLYRFDTSVLENLKTYDNLDGIMPAIAIAVGIIAVAAWIYAIGCARKVAYRFFRAIIDHRTAYLMLIPTFALILVFNYYPVFQAVYYAFTDWSMATLTMRDVHFIGFDNFVKMVEAGYFLMGLKNMAIIMLCSFVKLLTVPVILALLVFAMKSDKRRYWYRLLLIAPMVVPGVVSVLTWKNIFDPNDIGALNSVLKALGLISENINWLGSGKYALLSIILMGFPWVHGMAFLVFYGGLIDIPADLFEAAKVDGSNPWWDLWHIKIPLITPQLKMMFILTFISSIQDYGGVLLLTGGGPGHETYVPGLELYFNATTFGQYGYACALGLVMFAFIMVGTLVNLKMKTQDLG